MLSQIKLYFFGAVLIAFLGLAATALWYRGQAISAHADAARAQADLATAVSVNAANSETIGRLRAADAAKDAVLARYADDLSNIHKATAETSAAVEDLKDANEDVRGYLAGKLPDALGLQLNR